MSQRKQEKYGDKVTYPFNELKSLLNISVFSTDYIYIYIYIYIGDFDIVVSEFEFQSRYYFFFQINTVMKVINPPL